MKAAFVVFAVLAVVALKVNADLAVVCSGDQVEGEIEYHPHPCNCNAYYVCMGTEPVLKTCLKGLHWYQKKKSCDWPTICRKHPDCPK